jgi:hypothetical protein
MIFMIDQMRRKGAFRALRITLQNQSLPSEKHTGYATISLSHRDWFARETKGQTNYR